jgi:hypothetical protein
MTKELFEWIEIVVHYDIRCENYYYIYEILCYN